jgi:hypothetical protein
MKTTMLWCSAHQPTQEQINELEEKGRLILLKEHSPKMMERISNCPNNRQEIKELISDFRDVLESFDACTIVQLGGSPLFLFMAGSFIQGAMNKGNILFSHSERVSIDTPQPDGSVVKTSVFKHLGFI